MNAETKEVLNNDIRNKVEKLRESDHEGALALAKEILMEERLLNEVEKQSNYVKEQREKNSQFHDELELKRENNYLEHEKFEHQIKNDEERQAFEHEKFEHQKKVDEYNIEVAKKESRNRLIIALVTTLVPILLVEVPALIITRNHGYRALAMEYIDNGIEPRQCADAFKDVKKYLKKH